MKSIVRSLALFFAALCLVSSAFAIGAAQSTEAPAASAATETQVVVVTGQKLSTSAVAEVAALPLIATTENFSLGEWRSLWAYFIAQKLPRHEWPKYWKDACDLSKIACTEVAWKHLPVTAVVVVPRSPSAILADETHRALAQFAAERAAPRAEIAEMSRSILRMKEESLRSKIDFSLMSLVALSMFGLCSFLLLRWRLAERRLRNTCGCGGAGRETVPTAETKPKSSRGCACGYALSDPEELAEMNAGDKCATSCGSASKAECCADGETTARCNGAGHCKKSTCGCSCGKRCHHDADAVVPSSEKPAVLPDVDPSLFDAWSPRAPTPLAADDVVPKTSEPVTLKFSYYIPEIELGYADVEDGTGTRCSFDPRTEGYCPNFVPGQIFKAIVNSEGWVVKILPATPT